VRQLKKQKYSEINFEYNYDDPLTKKFSRSYGKRYNSRKRTMMTKLIEAENQ
jgi:hypothetical protein